MLLKIPFVFVNNYYVAHLKYLTKSRMNSHCGIQVSHLIKASSDNIATIKTTHTAIALTQLSVLMYIYNFYTYVYVQYGFMRCN